MTFAPNEKTNRPLRLPRSRKGIAAVMGLGMFAVAGTALGFTSTDHAAALANTSSAAAAEAINPSAPAMPSFANLVEKLKPAVVSVYVDAQIGNVSGFGQPEAQPGENPLGPNSPFEFFFRQFGQQPHGMPAQRVRAQGSGFFISADGYILTNNHVVQNAKRVRIKTTEGKTLDAKVVGTDAKTDLAVLKVTDSGKFSFVKFASAPPRVGDWVLAMGNPFGLGGTVTAGIVSASGRDIGAGPYNDYLQIDAPVNKGNSGGPSFNMQGEVVGINTAIYSPSGGSIGIAFDIPATTAKKVAEQLKTKGSITRGWIGVMVQPITADIADSLGLKEAKGALIDQVQRGGPAAKAGLRSGDVVLSVGGEEIKNSRDLARKVADVAPGKPLTLKVQRGGSEQTIAVTAENYPDQQKTASWQNNDQSSTQDDPKLGLYLAPANQLQGAGSSGAVVMGVDPNGIAAEKGLRQGDVILDAGGKAVAEPSDVSKAVSDARKAGKHSILMRVQTADATRYVALPINEQG